LAKLSESMTRTLAEAAEGLKALEDEVITTCFDPEDPESIQAAIPYVEDTIDARITRSQGNALVQEAANQVKAECRVNILEQVENADVSRGSRTLH
jgi:hypothetical protein